MIARCMFLATVSAGFMLSDFTMPASAQEKLKVVASFSILGDMVCETAGDAVELTTIVGFDRDAHSFQPRPADSRALADADLVIVSGIGFEPWMERLSTSAGFKGRTIVASTGVETRAFSDGDDHEDGEEQKSHDAHEDANDTEQHDAANGDDHDAHANGATDPHAWHYPANGIVYIRNIAAALIEADPANADHYRQRSETYVARLQTLDGEIREKLAQIPADRRKVVTTHNSLGYFAQAYGFEFHSPQGASTEAEPSAADVKRIIDQIRDEGISAVFLENSTNARLLEQITRETGVKIGGTLYTDALSGPDGPAPSYEALIRYNADQLLSALGPN